MKSQSKSLHSRRKNPSIRKLNLKPSFLDAKTQQKFNLTEFHESRNQMRVKPYTTKRIEISNHRSPSWMDLFNPNAHEVPLEKAIVIIPPKQPTLPIDFRSRFTADRISEELKKNSDCIKKTVLRPLTSHSSNRSSSYLTLNRIKSNLELGSSDLASPILSGSGDSFLHDSGTLRFRTKIKTPALDKLSDSDFIITGTCPTHLKNETSTHKPNTQQSNLIQNSHSFTQQASFIRRKTFSDIILQPINTKSFNTEVIPAKCKLRYTGSELADYFKHMNKKPFK